MRLLKSNHSDYADILTNLGPLIGPLTAIILIIIVPNKVTCNNVNKHTIATSVV